MALVSIPGFFVPAFQGTSSVTNAMTVDAAGEKAAMIITIPKTGTLDQFEWEPGAVTINAGSVIRASFQNLDATTGFPDGTQDQFRDISPDPSTGTWSIPGLITSDGTDTGTKRSVTVGEQIACVLEYSTFTAADLFRWQYYNTARVFDQTSYPALKSGAGPTWAKQTAGICPLALKYNDGTYGYFADGFPVDAITQTIFNSGSGADETGLKFKFPCPVKIGGIMAHLYPDVTNTCDFVLYDADGATPLATVTLDGDQVMQPTAIAPVMVRFADVTLLANTYYRAIIKPGATNVRTLDFTVNSAAILDAMGGGQNFHHTSRVDAGAWTDTTTRRPFMSLLVTAIDDGASGGGLLVHPGMAGGFRG